MAKDITNSSTQHQELRVSLRGKLAQDYVRMKEKDLDAASAWVRKVCTDAVGGHPQLAYRMEPDKWNGQRFVVGLAKELGTMVDW